MNKPAIQSVQSEYEAKLNEYHTLSAKLLLPDTFKSPQKRSEAAAKLKALRNELNGIYLDRHGLR